MRVAQARIGPRARARGRALGASLAATIALAMAVGLWLLAETDALHGAIDESLVRLAALGAGLGVPIGGLLGCWHAPIAASSHGFRRCLLVPWLATWAVLLGASLAAVILAIGSVSGLTGDGSMLTGAMGLPTAWFGEVIAYGLMALVFGLMLFGLPAWVLAAVVAALWVTIVGAIRTDSPPPANGQRPGSEQGTTSE